MILKNQPMDKNNGNCAWCGKSFNKTRMVKSNGLDVCKVCDAKLRKKERSKLIHGKKIDGK